jgi:hypothetical protein
MTEVRRRMPRGSGKRCRDGENWQDRNTRELSVVNVLSLV